MTAEPDVLAALDAASALPFDMSRVTAAERAVALADDLGRMEHQVAARLLLTGAYYHAPSGPHEFPAYAWLLAALDSGVPDDQQRQQILWNAKWAMDRMLDTPDIPLDVVRRTYDDIERRYRAEGYTDNAYAQYRTMLALQTEGRTEADHWLAIWRGAPRDEMSDCPPCESRSLATVLADRGDHLTALELVSPVLEGQASCSSEPGRSLSRAADWYMRIGSPDSALGVHLRGWRTVSDDLSEVGSVGRHLVFLVRSGNTARALRLLLPRLDWLDQLPSPGDRMWFAATAAAVLDTGVREGLAPAEVGGEPTSAAAQRLTALAEDLARRFDARNGTTVVSAGVAGVLAAERYAATVDFGALSEPATARAGTPEPPADVTAEATTPGSTTSGATTPGATTPEATTPGATTRADETPLPDTVRGFETELRASTRAMDDARGQALVEGWAGRRDQLGVESAEDWAAVAYLERQSAHGEMGAGDPAAYRERLGRALEAAERAGSETQRLRTLVSLAHADALEGDDHAWDRALGHIEQLERRGDVDDAAGGLLMLARTPDPSDAAERAERASQLFARINEPLWSAYALQVAGWARSYTDPQRAVAMTTDARTQLERLGASPRLLATCLSSQAQAQWRSGDLDIAAATYREAIDVAQRGGLQHPLDLRIALCDTLTDAEEWSALETEATALVESGRSLAAEHAVALGQRYLGLALTSTGRPLEGAEALESALPVLRSADDPSAAPALWALGNALADLGEAAQASATFAEAAQRFAQQGRPNETSHAHERAGSCAWDVDDLDSALEHFEAGAPLARESGDLRLFVALRRSRAAALATRDLEAGLEALRSVLGEARDMQAEEHVEAEIDQDYLSAMLERQAGLILADQGEWGQACTAAAEAERALVAVDPESAAVARSERGRYLAAWGQEAEAEQVLRESLSELRSPHLASHRVEAAAALARLLAGQGQDDEAERVWAEYGPDAG